MATFQDVLDNFAKDLPQGKADPTYIALINAINSSPDLAQQMTTAITNGALTAIVYNANGQGGDFDPANGAIELSSGLLQGLVTKANSADPIESAKGVSSLVSLLAHETSHSNFADTVNNERQDYANTHGVPTNSSITQWIQDYRQFGLDDEALANITSWNDAVEAATLANGGALNAGQIQDLVRGNDFAYPMFKLDGGVPVPISGVTMNADGTIDLNSSLSAVSNGLRLIRPSTETTPSDYLVFYTRDALNEAASRTSGLVSVSYNTLGLTVPATSSNLVHAPTSTDPYESELISEWLAAGTFTQKTTVLNSDDGSKATFEANASHTGTTLTYEWAVTADNEQSYEVLDVGPSGFNFGHVVTIAFDGTTTATLLGTGDTLNMSLADVVLTAGVSGTVNGDKNNISLYQGAALDLSGTGNLVKTVGNEHVNLRGDGSSVTLQGPYGNVTLMASHQTVTMGQGMLVAGDGLVGETLIGSPGTGAPGQIVLVSVQAGNDVEFTVQNTGVYYTGKDRNTLRVSGGAYDLITVGNDSHLDVTGMDGGQVSLTASNSEVILAGAGYDSLNGSHDTITLNHVSNVGISGGHQTINGSAVSVSINGDGNAAELDDGVSLSLGSGSGNTVKTSRSTLRAGAGDAVFNGSYNTFDLDNGTFEIDGEQNSLDLSHAKVKISGSGYIVSGHDSTVTVASGSGDDLQVSDSTITAVDDADFLLSGDGNTVTAGKGTYTITGDDDTVTAGDGTFTVAGNRNVLTAGTGTFSITGYDATVTAGDGSSISTTWATTIDTDQSTITYQGNDSQHVTLTGSGNTVRGSQGYFNIHGAGNHIDATGTGIYLTASTGTTDVNGSGNQIFADGATVSYTGDSATGVHGSKAGIEIWGNNDTVLASHSQIGLVMGPNITVVGAGNTIDTGYVHANVTVQGANMTDVTTLKTYDTETHANTGYFAIDGEDSTFYGGDGSHLHAVSVYTNTLYVNNATIDMDYESDLVVYGNNNTFTGGSFTHLTITGTGNSVTTVNGQIAFVGDNTGDVVFGAGNSGSNWSAPDPDLPPGDHGGYHPPAGGALAGGARVDSLIHAMASFGSESSPDISHVSTPQQDVHFLGAAA